jgi:two-component system sensor histidine kinase UhpB
MDDIGIKQTIMGSYFSDKMEVLNIQYHPQVSGDVERLSESQKVAIFRTLQEAVTNTLKHANAKHFYVDLHINTSNVILSIEDDGQGMPPHAASSGGEFGLHGIEDKVISLGVMFKLTVITRLGLLSPCLCGTTLSSWFF